MIKPLLSDEIKDDLFLIENYSRIAMRPVSLDEAKKMDEMFKAYQSDLRMKLFLKEQTK